MTSNELLLYRLAELMLEHEQHILSVDLLFDDEQIGDFVKSIQIDSPYQQMLIEGVLTESFHNGKLYVSYTVEGYFHHVLGSLLYRLSANKPSDYFIQLLSSNSLKGLLEGITVCLINQTTNSNFDCTIELIDKGDNFINLTIAPMANAFALNNVDQMLSLLLQNETENDFAVLYQVNSLLRKQNKIDVIDNILGLLKIRFMGSRIFTNQFYLSRLRIASLMYVSTNDIVQLADKSIEKKTEIIGEVKKEYIPVLLLDFYNVLVNKGHLKLSTSFAINFNIYDFETNLIIDNYYNIIYPLLETGKFELAEKIYLRCKNTHENNGVFLNWSGFLFQSWYELKSQDQKHLEIGLCLYKKSSELIDKELGIYSIRKYENLENLGYTYGLMGDHEKSLLYLNKAISIVSKAYRTEISYPLGNLYEMKAATLNELGKYTEALDYTFLSDKCKLLQIEPDSPEFAWNHYDRAKIYVNMGNIIEAKNAMLKALQIRESTLGIDNELTTLTKKEYEDLVNGI
ncbi:MAG: tetratricopeptide repeat protein [Bacteroidia bacterium]|nr:tetratricopeptide repeat protein [Bacteroidia bacterium]